MDEADAAMDEAGAAMCVAGILSRRLRRMARPTR
jgi:hypothetical protein